MSGLTSSSGLCAQPMLAQIRNTGSGYSATTQAALPALRISFPSLVSIIVFSNSGTSRVDSTYYHQ